MFLRLSWGQRKPTRCCCLSATLVVRFARSSVHEASSLQEVTPADRTENAIRTPWRLFLTELGVPITYTLCAALGVWSVSSRESQYRSGRWRGLTPMHVC